MVQTIKVLNCHIFLGIVWTMISNYMQGNRENEYDMLLLKKNKPPADQWFKFVIYNKN